MSPKPTGPQGRTPEQQANFERIKQDWQMLGSEEVHAPKAPTATQKAKAKVKSWGPAYRKFQDVVVGIAG